VIQAISSTYAADETPVYLAAQDLIRASTTANPSTTLILSDTQVVASAVTKFDQQLATLAASAPPNVANALRVEEVDNEAVVRDIGAEVAAKTQAALAAAQTALNSEGMSATTAANAVKTDLGLPTCPSSITC
jgi:hypothetical protein